MKTEHRILTAFILNLSFAIAECIGGMLIGSIAIVSDAVHDLGDAASIGISYVLEKKSRQQPDDTHTYGYTRYAVLGGCLTSLVLMLGSIVMIANAVVRLLAPTPIDYDNMIVFAVVGVIVNGSAAVFTHGGVSLNQKAVNWHMLEDVLGWAVVLLGAVTMRFTDWCFLDPLLSIGVSVFILCHAISHLKEIITLFLDTVPPTIDIAALKADLSAVDGITDVHHLHIRRIDEQHLDAALHIVSDQAPHNVKNAVRAILHTYGIDHVTVELETSNEHCDRLHCHITPAVHHHPH